MKKLIVAVIGLAIAVFMLFAVTCFAQCTGEILDIEHVIPNSGSQFRFITQYICNEQVVDVQGQPCDDCKQGNRVGGDKSIVEARAEGEEQLSIHSKILNGRYGDNANKLNNSKRRIYAESKGVSVNSKTDEQVYSKLKAILTAESQADLLFKHDNVVNNIEELKKQTVGYKKTEDKYEETYMNKKIEVDTSEKVTVTDLP